LQWLRPARADKQRRTTAVWYAVGITVVQVLWLLRLALPDDWSTPAFLLLVIYLIFVWLLHIRPHQVGPLVIAYPVVAVLVLLTPLGPAPVHVLAGLLAVLVAITVALGRRVPDPVG
jgi:uncharacterized membrane protein YfcA